jgi:hypothetical protein
MALVWMLVWCRRKFTVGDDGCYVEEDMYSTNDKLFLEDF